MSDGTKLICMKLFGVDISMTARRIDLIVRKKKLEIRCNEWKNKRTVISVYRSAFKEHPCEQGVTRELEVITRSRSQYSQGIGSVRIQYVMWWHYKLMAVLYNSYQWIYVFHHAAWWCLLGPPLRDFDGTYLCFRVTLLHGNSWHLLEMKETSDLYEEYPAYCFNMTRGSQGHLLST